ncbi:MAG: 1,2-phenylacetyl-CoA epoxidase subunit PaaC [Vibrio sp.]
MNLQALKLEFLLQQADTNLILSHRLGEWCGIAPELEIDMALANIGLDLLGEARNLYQYAGELEGKGQTEDDFAYLREEREYKNLLLVERPNNGFDATITRQFLYDHFHVLLLKKLAESKDQQISAIAKKSQKEAQYHLRFSTGWMVRLGDGTELSHRKVQNAMNELWSYSHEMFSPSDDEIALIEAGEIPDLRDLKAEWLANVQATLNEATLIMPESPYFHFGGKTGRHSEHLGYILAELQYMQRTYPNQQW